MSLATDSGACFLYAAPESTVTSGIVVPDDFGDEWRLHGPYKTHHHVKGHVNATIQSRCFIHRGESPQAVLVWSALACDADAWRSDRTLAHVRRYVLVCLFALRQSG